MMTKNFSLILIAVLSLALSAGSAEAKKAKSKKARSTASMDNPPEGYDVALMTDLKKYKVEDLAKDKENLKNRKELNIDLMFQALQQVVAYCEKRDCHEDFYFQAERVALITMTKDISEYGPEILAPLYNSRKDSFKKAALRLPNADMIKILESLKNAGKAEENGNG